MPYVADVYSLPPGSTATPNTTIESAKYNTLINDLATAQNTARPVLGGGTGGQTAVAGSDGLNTKGADIASGSTTDLSAATGIYLNITGTTTINSFGTVAAGALRQLTFTGILTITYNATSMILPGAANITTAVGDTATFRSLGGGNWRCVDYLRASGQSVTNIITSPNITGATTISTTTAGGNILTLTNTDPGALGLDVPLIKDSSSPAAADVIVRLIAYGKDSATNTTAYGLVLFGILDPTNTSEDGYCSIQTVKAGVFSETASWALGQYMAGATGGDKGAGTINATNLYKNGTALPFQAAFESAQQTITNAGSLTLAHGLGVKPKLYTAVLQCTTANLGYAIDDEVGLLAASLDATAGTRGLALWPDVTNMNVRYTVNSMQVPHKTTGTVTAITNSSWALVVRAWA